MNERTIGNQSLSQSINQSISQSINQSIPLSVTVWPQFAMQSLTVVPIPKSPLPTGDRHLIPSNGFSRVHECDRQTAIADSFSDAA